jgi:hypothetical protein
MLKDSKNKKKSFLIWFFLGFYVLKKFFRMRKERKLHRFEKNFKSFLHKEQGEIKEYLSGKEDLSEFASDSGGLFRDYFIPHSGNNHMPLILRTRSLTIITLLAVVLKFSLVAYLYFVFPNSGKADDVMIPKIFELINKERASAGFKPLLLDQTLANSALMKANDMVEKDYFAHTTPDGKKPWDFVSRDLYPYSIVGENLAMNFTTAESAHKALINSPSHKHNILNEKYQDVGLAIVRGDIGGKTTNVLVQLFSARVALDTSAPIPAKQAIAEPEKTEEKVAVLASESPKEPVTTSPAPTPSPVASAPVSAPKTETVTAVPSKPASANFKSSETVAKPVAEPPAKKIETVKTEPKAEAPSPAQPAEAVLNSNELDTGQTEAPKEEVPVEIIRVIKHPGDQVLAKNVEEQLNYMMAKAAIEESSLPNVETVTEHSQENNFLFSERLIRLVQIAIAAILSLLIIALLLNIFIRFEIQHKPVLLRTALVLVFVIALLFINFHYLEGGMRTIYMS